ncbi:hypothetical protein GC194_12745 [bacterium]|nr:hypothetical protein [bacterium]
MASIYSKNTIEQLNWEDFEKGAELKVYLRPLVQNGTNIYATNTHCEVVLVTTDSQIIPVIVASGKKNQSYVVSMLGQYFNYSLEEIKKGDFPKSSKMLASVFFPLGRSIARLLGFEKVVFVNNWLFSSNLHSLLSDNELAELTKLLRSKYKKHAIAYRSVDEKGTPELQRNLLDLGYKGLSARLLYYLDFNETNIKKKRPYQQDLKRWKKQDEYQSEILNELTDSHIDSILQYYSELYIQKHSIYNPAYTKLMIRNLFESKLLHFAAIVKGDTLKAIQLIWLRNAVATTPFIGYDQSEPVENGLYRHLNVQLTQFAQQHKALLNMSSGAGKFKKQRGGIPIFEYNMLYIKHLPPHRKFIWNLMCWAGLKYFQPGMLQKEV